MPTIVSRPHSAASAPLVACPPHDGATRARKPSGVRRRRVVAQRHRHAPLGEVLVLVHQQRPHPYVHRQPAPRIRHHQAHALVAQPRVEARHRRGHLAARRPRVLAQAPAVRQRQPRHQKARLPAQPDPAVEIAGQQPVGHRPEEVAGGKVARHRSLPARPREPGRPRRCASSALHRRPVPCIRVMRRRESTRSRGWCAAASRQPRATGRQPQRQEQLPEQR